MESHELNHWERDFFAALRICICMHFHLLLKHAHVQPNSVFKTCGIFSGRYNSSLILSV